MQDKWIIWKSAMYCSCTILYDEQYTWRYRQCSCSEVDLKHLSHQICSQTVAAWNSVRCPAPFPDRAKVCITVITSWNPALSVPIEESRDSARGNMAVSRAWGTNSTTGLAGFTKCTVNVWSNWRFSLNCSSSMFYKYSHKQIALCSYCIAFYHF